MRIDILTVLPGLLSGPFSESIVKRGIEKGLVEVHVHDLRQWSTNKHKKVDDAPFGTAAGMVLAMQPLHDAISSLQAERTYDEVIFLTPDGEQLKQGRVNQLSLSGNLLMICGHYKGIDQRLRDHVVTLEISIGDYVLSGGELAAAVLTDALVRLVPGVIGDETSALSDSFQDGLLAPPVYTRPAEYNGWKVPDVLLSGNHAAIDKWQEEQALARTRERRPDLLKGSDEATQDTSKG
ncbi:MAG: tRNA (guanosine(37)-N1)-methyltransferase TrmD [Bacteroidota bacterium]|nr:tRNA (guanosine(37)-N1)-methyltransferase TrmD [Bacteroidota bacterium]